MKFRAPATVFLRRAQFTLMLATLVPTVLLTAVGIVLLAVGSSRALSVVAGILVLAFCTTSVTGYILGSIFVYRGESAVRLQHDFLSLVSHELRTPLTSIALFIESLRDERLTDEAEKKRCLDLLSQETGRLQELVEKLIALIKMESGRHALDREVILVKDIVDDALSSLKILTLDQQVNIAVEVDDHLAIIGDRPALAKAVFNLLTNAWKYTDSATPEISISAGADGGWAIIEVTDNGPGISRVEQDQIFETFQRGEAAHMTGKQGSGLGLAIVRAIVRAHRGKIELSSQLGHGSTFRIKLKLA